MDLVRAVAAAAAPAPYAWEELRDAILGALAEIAGDSPSSEPIMASYDFITAALRSFDG